MPADPPFDLAQIDRLLTTTKAVRRRLDLTRPVDRDAGGRLHPARPAYAPNASNAQEWHWVVVDDPERAGRGRASSTGR